MRPTYAHLAVLIEEGEPVDRAPGVPLLGLFSGLLVAAALWSALVWLVWTIVS